MDMRGRHAKRRGPDSPCWKGDKVTRDTAYWRALQLFPGPHVCQHPGCKKKAQRHRIDGNPWNNVKENIAFFCPKHHARAEDRGRHRRGKERTDLSPEARRALGDRLAALNRARKGLPHTPEHNAAVSAAITLWWARRKGSE